MLTLRPAPVTVIATCAMVALSAILTGCSTSAPASLPSSASKSAAADPSHSAAAGAGSGTSASSLDRLCSLLTLDAANAVVGVVFTSATDSVDASTGDHLCTYRSGDGSDVAVLGLVTAGRTSYDALEAKTASPFEVDEVGDRASYHDNELDFQTGDHVFYVLTTGSDDLGLGNLTALGSATCAYLK